jgi:Ca2+-binding EF-hand superfamily protein
MGNNQGSDKHPDAQSVELLKKKYKISANTWSLLMDSFKTLSNGDTIEKEAFAKHYGKTYDEQVAKSIAAAMDIDRSNKLSLYEYLRFYFICIGGTKKEKITLFFQVLDADGSGKVSSSELVNFLVFGAQKQNPDLTKEKAQEKMNEVASTLIDGIDKNGDGELSLKEVISACEKSPSVHSFFTSFAKGIASPFSKDVIDEDDE